MAKPLLNTVKNNQPKDNSLATKNIGNNIKLKINNKNKIRGETI